MLYAQVEAQAREAIRKEMKTTTDAKQYRRLKIIDLSGQGYKVTDLAQLFDVSEATVRSYIYHFNTAGMDGLQPHYGRGRPRTLTWGRFVIRPIFIHLLSGRANSLSKNPDLRKKTSVNDSSLVS